MKGVTPAPPGPLPKSLHTRQSAQSATRATSCAQRALQMASAGKTGTRMPRGSMDTSTTARSRSGPMSPSRARSSNQTHACVSSPWRVDPQIEELAQGRPAHLMALLREVGAQTCRDVKMLWPTGSSLVEEYEAAHGRLDATQSFSIHSFWTMVSGRSHQEEQKAADAVIHDRASTLLIHPAPEPGEPARPKILSYRQMITTGSLPSPPILSQAAESDPHAKEKANKDRKVDALFHLLLEDVLDLQELGLDLEQIQDPANVQKLKETVMAQPSQLSTTRLGALASSFRRWRRYALAHQCSIRKPTPLQLAAFFTEASRGGPTAAAALWQSLRWFEDKMGLPLGLQHFLVKPFQYLPAAHSAVQAPELQPWEFVNLVMLACKQRGTNLIILGFILMTAVSCIRFEHVQRSSWTAHHQGWTEFWCRQGKRRIRGARPGYAWCMPEVAFQGFSLFKVIKEFLAHEALPGVSFLWPSLQLQSEDFYDVSEATPFIIDKPLTRSRFLELFRGALIQAGLPPPEATSSGYNRLRRFMPTLAACLGLEGNDLQAVGSWVEIPSAGGPTPRVKSRAVWLMGRHYGGGQCHQSAMVKQAMLARFWAIFRRKLGDLALTESHMLPRDSWTWEEFTVTNGTMAPLEMGTVEPPPPPSEQVVIDADSSLDPAIPLANAPSPPPEEEQVLGSESDWEEADSSTTSSSASDVSGRGEELEDLPPLDNAADGMLWFRQGSKTHITRAKDDDHRAIPWCRDMAFTQDAKASGAGFGTCSRALFCQRCLARLPRGAYTALADLCGWLH